MSESSLMDTTALYSAVVMLWAAPIDKHCAAAMLERALDVRGLPVALFWQSTSCSPETKVEWEAKGWFPIDIGNNGVEGVDEKYHSIGYSSATGYVASTFGLQSQGVLDLIAITNKNNATGYLKHGYRSIAKTVRQLPEMDEYDPQDIARRAIEVAHAFLDAIDNPLDASRTEESLLEALPELVAETRQPGAKKLCLAPFTPGGYLWNLWRIGTPVAEIEEKVLWWVEGCKHAKVLTDAADAKLKAMDRSTLSFVVNGEKGDIPCLRLETPDRVLASRTGHDKSFRLRVIKDPTTGHAVIAGNGFNLRAIAEHLERQEPGLWYYGKGAIINGGPTHKNTPGTKCSLDKLVEIVKQYLFAK